jgi:transposase-like protein
MKSLNCPKCDSKRTKKKQSMSVQLIILGLAITIVGIPLAVIIAGVSGYYTCKDCDYTWK